MATTAYDIIKRPIITEQSMEQTEMKRYTFEVAKTANKIEIAKAIEEIFGVKAATKTDRNTTTPVAMNHTAETISLLHTCW